MSKFNHRSYYLKKILKINNWYQKYYNKPLFETNLTGLDFISYNITAPTMVNYVWWILLNVTEQKINTIYFLARDGQLLMKIAKLFIEEFTLDIKCEYLYCSRKSLRMPTYHFLGNEALDLLFADGYNVTFTLLCNRLEMTDSEKKVFLNLVGIDKNDVDLRLSRKQIHFLRKYFEKNTELFEGLMKKSKQSYSNILKYLNKIDFFKNSKICIIDSGWNGSLQRSLNQIIKHYKNHNSEIIGFYFGLYKNLDNSLDGKYYSWMFNYKDFFAIKFNNNLFECMLYADHGMTIGYDDFGNPILGKKYYNKLIEIISDQQAVIIDYSVKLLKEINFFHFNTKIVKQYIRYLLEVLMFKPNNTLVQSYQDYIFSDDIIDSKNAYLVKNAESTTLKQYLLINRIRNKFLSTSYREKELFWIYGTLSYSNRLKRWWYRLNVYIWEFIKILKRRIK